jgi:hypothetical protein
MHMLCSASVCLVLAGAVVIAKLLLFVQSFTANTVLVKYLAVNNEFH